MTLYYAYMTLEVNPSLNLPNHGCFPDFSSYAVVFYLTMKYEIYRIPDLLRLEQISKIFASKLGHVSCDRRLYIDGLKTNESIGYGVFNKLHSTAYKLQSACSIYIA